MAKRITLSVDAMGGDDAPDMVIEGVHLSCVRHPDVHFLLFGDQARLEPILAKYPRLADCSEIIHTTDVVTGDDKPSQALRQRKDSSMFRAVGAVKDGQADGVVSAGNTGALMAMALLALRALPGISRPAIVTTLPNTVGETVMLDLGANAECSARHLVEFAVMGEVYARTLHGIQRPTVGLLNIGTEELKGTGTLRDAAAILREAKLEMDFHGFVEGDDIAKGTVDVVVTDGFTGNVALKAIEGTAKLVYSFISNGFRASLLAKLGYLIARGSIKRVVMRTDPRRYNGALFVGLNGIAVKSHGGTDALGFANAIGVAVDMVDRRLNEQIGAELANVDLSSLRSSEAESGA